MSQSMARLKIGGQISQHLYERLLEEIHVDYSETRLNRGPQGWSRENGWLEIWDEIAESGEFRNIERFLVRNTIAFDRISEAVDEYLPELAQYRPGNDPRYFLTESDQDIVVQAYAITQLLERIQERPRLEGREMLITSLKELIGADIEDLPILQVFDSDNIEIRYEPQVVESNHPSEFFDSLLEDPFG